LFFFTYLYVYIDVTYYQYNLAKKTVWPQWLSVTVYGYHVGDCQGYSPVIFIKTDMFHIIISIDICV